MLDTVTFLLFSTFDSLTPVYKLLHIYMLNEGRRTTVPTTKPHTPLQ